MILQETIEKVFDLDIVEVIGRYVELKKAGANYKGLSPFTSERTPSFLVSPAKRIFKCFSSGKGGSLVKFIMEKEMMDYPDAIRFICKNHSLECIESEETNEEKAIAKHKEAMYVVNQVSANYFIQNLNYFQDALNYVYGERQLTANIINKFGIGFAPSTLSGLTNFLINSGYSWNVAVEVSVLGHIKDKNNLYDRFRNRMMFPIKGISGNLLGFGGRSLNPDERNAKYINSSDSIIYNKSHILYGIFESKKAIIEKDECLISEGYLDVVMFHQKEVENIIATGGTALTTEHVKLIKRFTKKVIVMFDNDKAGIRAAMKGIDVLLEEEMYVKVLILPLGQDPDDFAKSKNKKEIEEYIFNFSQDFVLFKTNYLLQEANGNPNLITAAIEDVLQSIAKMPDIVRRDIYLKECERISKVSISILRTTIKKFVTEETNINAAAPQTFYEQFLANRNYIQAQCERKILQYVLGYGNLQLTFKEVYIDKVGSAGLKKIKEVQFDATRTVLEKVQYELETDGIHFLNLNYAHIYEKAKLADLRNFNTLEQYLDTENYLLAIELRNDELNGNKNVFTYGDSLNNSNLAVKDLHSFLQISISENLLFYKIVYIEWLIEEESRKLNPNKQDMKDYIELIIRIKKDLNTI